LRKLTELPYQQTMGGLWQDAHSTLTDLRFLEAKATTAGVEKKYDANGEANLTHTGVLLLQEDLELALDRWPQGAAGALRPLRDALGLSSHVLLRDPAELRSQLAGRLAPDLPDVESILKQVGAKVGKPWLRPLTPTLAGPGGGLIRTLTDWAGYVECIAITPDGRRAVTGGLDGQLDVWDLLTESRLHDLKRFPNAITAVAITPDGRHAIVGAGGGAREIWELVSGTEPYALDAHPDTIEALGISRDGRIAASTSSACFSPKIDRRRSFGSGT
jgi:hypothetical protein